MNWLDAAIAFVSPEWGARRVAWRNELRNYDAGNDARLNAGGELQTIRQRQPTEETESMCEHEQGTLNGTLM